MRLIDVIMSNGNISYGTAMRGILGGHVKVNGTVVRKPKMIIKKPYKVSLLMPIRQTFKPKIFSCLNPIKKREYLDVTFYAL